MARKDAEERNERYLRLCDLPPLSDDYTFEKFVVMPGNKEAYVAALQLAQQKGLRWLTILGGVDRGKSHLAVAICRRWLARGRAARHIMVPFLLDGLRRGFAPDAQRSYEQEFYFFCNVPLLVLDDLGTESPTKWAQEKLETIVDYRYQRALPLVVTTNVPFSELPARIASRLQRAAESKVVVIETEEYRLVKAGRRKVAKEL